MLEFIELCFEKKIILLLLSFHTAHLLYSLDMTVFQPLRKYYNKETETYSRENYY